MFGVKRYLSFRKLCCAGIICINDLKIRRYYKVPFHHNVPISETKKDKMEDLKREVTSKQKKIEEDLISRREDKFSKKCACCFAKKSEFCQHIRDHLQEPNAGKSSYMSHIDKYICSICSKQFEVKSDLIIHYNTVCFDAPYTCKHCKENCENESFLQVHLLFYHKYSKEMLRDEGFLSDIDRDVASEYLDKEKSRNKAFKYSPSEDTDELYTEGTSTLPEASSFSGKSEIAGGKRENLPSKSVEKAYICEICNGSFSRKCALDIHVKNHNLKQVKKKRISRSVLETSSFVNSCKNIMRKRQNSSGAEVTGKLSNSVRAMLKPSNVVLGYSCLKNVPLKSKFRGVKTYFPTRKGNSKRKTLDIFERKRQHPNNIKAISPSSDAHVDLSAWKKIKLRSKVGYSCSKNAPKSKFRGVKIYFPTRKGVSKKKILDIIDDKRQHLNSIKAISASSDADVDLSVCKKIKLGSKVTNTAASNERKRPRFSKKNVENISKIKKDATSVNKKVLGTPKQKIKHKSEIKNFVVSAKQKDPKTSNVAMNAVSSNRKKHNETSKKEEEKAFACDVCKKLFKDNYKLKRHFLIHSGEKAYTCTKCKKSFARDDHMKRHLKKVCNKTNKMLQ